MEDGFIILQKYNSFASGETTWDRKRDCDYCKKLAEEIGI